MGCVDHQALKPLLVVPVLAFPLKLGYRDPQLRPVSLPSASEKTGRELPK